MANERTPVTPAPSAGGSLVSVINGSQAGGIALGQPVPSTVTTVNPLTSIAPTTSIRIGQPSTPTTAPTPAAKTPATTTGTMTTQAAAASAKSPADSTVRSDISQADASDINDAVQKLLSGKGYPNPLNGFRQVNYHFKLFMMNDADVYELAQKPNSLAELRRQIANFPQVIIAETGSTTYDIKSVSMESLVGPNDETRNTNATSFTLEVVEPVGTGFLTAIKVAAKALKVRNLAKAPYYLELRFNAYNADGTYCANPLAGQGYDGDGAWLWSIIITSIDTSFDARGGSYTITALPFAEHAFDENHITSPSVVAFEGNKLGDMADSLAAKLTVAHTAQYFDSSVQYAIKMHPLKDDNGNTLNTNVSNFQIANQKPDESPDRMLDMDNVNGVATANMQPGVKVTDALDWMLARTEEVQNLSLNRGNQQGSTSSNNSGSKSIGGRYVFRVEPDLQLTGKYDYVNDRYYKLITFHVRPFFTMFPIIDQQQKEDAKDSAVQKQMIIKMLGDEFLAKHYQYLYTGLNTEVMEFEVKANFSWNVVLDADEGAHAGNDAVTVAKMASPTTTNIQNGYVTKQAALRQQMGDLQTQITDVQKKVDSANGDVGKSLASITNLTQKTGDGTTQAGDSMTSSSNTEDAAKLDAAKADLAKAKAAFATADSERTKLTENFANAQNQLNEMVANGVLTSGASVTGIVYAEQIVGQQASGKDPLDDFNLNVSFAQGHNEAPAATGTGQIGQFHRDRSSMGVLLDQLYAPVTANLTQIDIGIRGDPYWIGDSSLTRQIICRSESNAARQKSKTPDYFKGDYMFLLTFRFPVQIGDDFKPVFQKDDVFNGIYKVRNVTSSFAGGSFKQTLGGLIFPLARITKMFVLNSENASDKSDAASPATKSGNIATKDATTPSGGSATA